MCRIAADVPPRAVADAATPRRSLVVVALAVVVGAALGLAELAGSVWWPPVVALLAGGAALAVAAPRWSWGLGLTSGLAAAVVDLAVGHGRMTAFHYGVFGAFGVVWPALVGAHFGRFVSVVAERARARGLTG